MTLGYTPPQAYATTWPEYLTYIIAQLPPEEEVSPVDSVKDRMRKVREAATASR